MLGGYVSKTKCEGRCRGVVLDGISHMFVLCNIRLWWLFLFCFCNQKETETKVIKEKTEIPREVANLYLLYH